MPKARTAFSGTHTSSLETLQHNKPLTPSLPFKFNCLSSHFVTFFMSLTCSFLPSRGFEINPVLFPVRNHQEMLQHLHDFVCKYEWHRPMSNSVSLSASVAVRNSLKALASLSSKTTPSQAWDEAQQLLAHFGSVNNIFAAVHEHCTTSAFFHNTIYQSLLEQPLMQPSSCARACEQQSSARNRTDVSISQTDTSRFFSSTPFFFLTD